MPSVDTPSDDSVCDFLESRMHAALANARSRANGSMRPHAS